MKDIISADAPEEIYISPVACQGIIRRAEAKNSKINSRLKEVLQSISSTMSMEEIEALSLRQPRGADSGMAKSTQLNKMAFLHKKQHTQCVVFCAKMPLHLKGV